MYNLTNERYKHTRQDFCSVAWVMSKGWELWGAGGAGGLFLIHDHVAYQIDGDDKQNRMQVQFPS